MNPRRIRTPAEKEATRKPLVRFYRNRPVSYALVDRQQVEYERHAALLEKYGRPGGRVLDFGCGTDRSPETIAGRGFSEVIGCDFSFDEAPGVLRSAGPTAEWRLVRVHGTGLPFPNAHFDVVSSLCVFEHLLDPEEQLRELDRVLKAGGVFVMVAPNWSGLNNPLRALFVTLTARTRYWLYETAADAAAGIVRALFWYLEVLFSRSPRFLLVAPRMREGEIAYETSDDDCVHLCQPLSFKRWLKGRGYDLLKYNRCEGRTPAARLFNAIAPSLATTNVIIARKPAAEGGRE